MKPNKLITRDQILSSLKDAFIKLNPVIMYRNPVMFTVLVATFIMGIVAVGVLFSDDSTQGSFGYNFTVFIILFATLLFANFAEAIAEARGKAQIGRAHV